MSKALIERTGGENNDFLFTHAVIQEEVDLQSVPEEVDFVSLSKEGSFDFYHITSTDNHDGIVANGLVLPESTYISDLGKGIYVVEQDDEEALANIKDYVSEFYGDDEDAKILLVSGHYEGPYTVCIQGEGHKGYILLKNTVSAENIEDTEEMFVEDFLWNY